MQKRQGFTLTELMVAVAVLAVLMAVGIPGFRWLISGNRLAAQANEMVMAVSFARSEALKRGRSVTVCRSGLPTAAVPACGGGAGWESGWIVFMDINSNGVIEASDADLDQDGAVDAGEDRNENGAHDVGDAILQVRGPLSVNTMRGNGNVADRITFNSRGLSPSGNLLLCDGGRKTFARNLRVAPTGRVVVEQYDDNYTNQAGMPCPG